MKPGLAQSRKDWESSSARAGVAPSSLSRRAPPAGLFDTGSSLSSSKLVPGLDGVDPLLFAGGSGRVGTFSSDCTNSSQLLHALHIHEHESHPQRPQSSPQSIGLVRVTNRESQCKKTIFNPETLVLRSWGIYLFFSEMLSDL